MTFLLGCLNDAKVISVGATLQSSKPGMTHIACRNVISIKQMAAGVVFCLFKLAVLPLKERKIIFLRFS